MARKVPPGSSRSSAWRRDAGASGRCSEDIEHEHHRVALARSKSGHQTGLRGIRARWGPSGLTRWHPARRPRRSRTSSSSRSKNSPSPHPMSSMDRHPAAGRTRLSSRSSNCSRYATTNGAGRDPHSRDRTLNPISYACFRSPPSGARRRSLPTMYTGRPSPLRRHGRRIHRSRRRRTGSLRTGRYINNVRAVKPFGSLCMKSLAHTV